MVKASERMRFKFDWEAHVSSHGWLYQLAYCVTARAVCVSRGERVHALQIRLGGPREYIRSQFCLNI